MDLSLENIWQSWFAFRKGKRATRELHAFQYELERNLRELHEDFNSGAYRHGGYTRFTVCDNKRRQIAVAGIRDRVVHRLIYDYLVPIYDETFIYDAWSCRKEKGLLACIERTQKFLTAHPQSYVWRADIRKFFDSVDHAKLLQILARRVCNPKALWLMREVVGSFPTAQREREREFIGMPIGNLTSQIFANIYLNELDRFVKHDLKVKQYLRYGDDFILIHPSFKELTQLRCRVIRFLEQTLKLRINPKNDRIIKAGHSLKFIGVAAFPYDRKLNRRSVNRVKGRLNFSNAGSYYGLVGKHGSYRIMDEFCWLTSYLLDTENE